MRWRVVRQVARTAFVEFWRSPAAVFWTYGFPLMMALVLGFAFQPAPPKPVPIAIVEAPGAEVVYASLRASARLEVEMLSAETADQALARGRVALMVKMAPGGPVLRSDPTRPEAEIASLLVQRALRDARDGEVEIARAEVEDRPGSRYIDFLIPGLIGLNLLGAGMWGVGFNLVQMRVQNLLRRIFVTPMRRSEFLAGYLLGRSILVIPEAFAILLFGVFVWGVPFHGSYLAALLAIVIGGWTFTGIGVLCWSPARPPPRTDHRDHWRADERSAVADVDPRRDLLRQRGAQGAGPLGCRMPAVDARQPDPARCDVGAGYARRRLAAAEYSGDGRPDLLRCRDADVPLAVIASGG